jgi:hypothetical protein
MDKKATQRQNSIQILPKPKYNLTPDALSAKHLENYSKQELIELILENKNKLATHNKDFRKNATAREMDYSKYP